jgi:hypothetical protein
VGENVTLPPRAGCGNPPVRFDRRGVETGHGKATEDRQTKELETARLNLNHRATPRLYTDPMRRPWVRLCFWKEAQFRATSREERVMQAKVRVLGLDVHTATIAVAVAEADGSVRSLGMIINRAELIRTLVKKLGAVEQLRACYEAGPTGYVLYWQLAELGVACEVIAPTLVPTKASDRVKTDRTGCGETCPQLPVGRLDCGVGDGRGSRGVARSGASTGSGQAGSVAGASPAEQVLAALRAPARSLDEGMDAGIYGLGAAALVCAGGTTSCVAGLLDTRSITRASGSNSSFQVPVT